MYSNTVEHIFAYHSPPPIFLLFFLRYFPRFVDSPTPTPLRFLLHPISGIQRGCCSHYPPDAVSQARGGIATTASTFENPRVRMGNGRQYFTSTGLVTPLGNEAGEQRQHRHPAMGSRPSDEPQERPKQRHRHRRCEQLVKHCPAAATGVAEWAHHLAPQRFARGSPGEGPINGAPRKRRRRMCSRRPGPRQHPQDRRERATTAAGVPLLPFPLSTKSLGPQQCPGDEGSPVYPAGCPTAR